MSSHVLDVSGARALTTTTNDPASTRVFMPSKPGDDVGVTLSGFRELRIELPENVRIQRRRYVRNDVVYENGSHGKPKPNPNVADRETHPYETVAVEFERTVLVATSLSGFGRVSYSAEEKAAAEAEGRSLYEQYPHTQILAKRTPDPHYLEAGELIEELTIKEWLDAHLAGDEKSADSPE